MDSATVELYLQKIEEFVHDEEKIVTFKWLSTNLDITATDAKKLLQQYVTDQRDLKPNALAVTYSLTGLLEDHTLGITVVKEDELDDKKDCFETVLKQEIYSVQKSKEVDLNVMSLVDYFDMHHPREAPVAGSVISKQSVKRAFKPKKALPPPREPTIKGKVSMFTKIPPKSSEKTDKTVASPKQNTKETAKPKQNGLGIASFFNKNSQTDIKPKEEKSAETQDIKADKLPVNDSKDAKGDRFKNLIDSDSDTEVVSTQSQSQASKPSKENQKPKQSAKRPRKQNKKNAPSPKRRRRIVEQEDSDDDIFGNDEEEENIRENVENSDEDSEPVMLAKPPLAPKNKKRKLVDRTFTDEDGYIITRKEWMEESPSEEEAETDKSQAEQAKPQVEEKKPDLKRKETEDVKGSDTKKSKKSANDSSGDKVANGKTKGGKGKKAVATNQPTLMNFFKRS